MLFGGSTPKVTGRCEVFVAGMIALLWCCVVVVLVVAEDDLPDMCLVKSVMGGRRNAEEGP